MDESKTPLIVDVLMRAAKDDFKTSTLPGWASAELAQLEARLRKVIRSKGSSIRDLEDVLDMRSRMESLLGCIRLVDPGSRTHAVVEQCMALFPEFARRILEIKAGGGEPDGIWASDRLVWSEAEEVDNDDRRRNLEREAKKYDA